MQGGPVGRLSKRGREPPRRSRNEKLEEIRCATPSGPAKTRTAFAVTRDETARLSSHEELGPAKGHSS